MTLSDVVEVIKSLSTEEKHENEIQALLQQYLREERREEIYTASASRTLREAEPLREPSQAEPEERDRSLNS